MWLTQNIKNRKGVVQSGLIERRKRESDLYLQGTSEDQMSESQGDVLDEPVESKSLEGSKHIIPYTHSRGSEKMTVDELLNSKKFITSDLTKAEVLELSHKGKTNHLRLYESLSKTMKREYGEGGSDEYSDTADYPIVSGSTIYIDSERIKVDITYQSNITVQNVKSTNYWPSLIKSMTNDPGYVPAYKLKGVEMRSIIPQLSIFVWSRNLYIQQGRTGGFIDITKDVIDIHTDNSISSGGNFSVEVGSAVAQYDDDTQQWMKSGDLGPVHLGNINRRVSTDGYKEYRRTDMFYERVFQQNDLVFISFEKLDVEELSSISESIDNRWIDMIGMIDFIDLSHDGAGNSVGVTIRGRDFTKALMDDNSYFNLYSIGHTNSLYGGVLGDRFLQGEFKNLSAYLAVSIRDKVEFIVHRIASIGYVPDDVFSTFKDKTYVVEDISAVGREVESYSEMKPAKGIWQLVKIFIDPSIEDLRLADDSVSNPEGSILDLFKKIAQFPFVEFFTDTYKDKFYLFFRQPPFSKKALHDVTLGLEQAMSNEEESDESSISNSSIDESEQDSAKKDYMMISDDSDQTDDSSNLPVIINVSEVDVHSTSLSYNNEAYSWYQIEQRGSFAGNTVTLGHVPSVYFDEYAQIFGNRRMSVVSNYSDYKFFEHREGAVDKDLYAELASQQLSYIVETSIYLPFTRKGSITLNGDRRIRKGNWIFFRPTNEFFYVISVSNNLKVSTSQIDRTTTIQVERGMVKDYVVGRTIEIDGEEVDVSYFNIVNLERFKKGVYDTVTKGLADDKFDYKSDMAINTKVLDFFLQRRT